MSNYNLIKIVSLGLILICSGALFYYAMFLNKKIGEVIQERDNMILKIYALEKENFQLRIKMEYMEKASEE